MKHRHHELLLERGRLLERIALEREALAAEAAPLVATIEATDRTLYQIRWGLHQVIAHPALLVVGLLIAISKPGRALFRYAKRGVSLWQTSKTLWSYLIPTLWRPR